MDNLGGSEQIRWKGEGMGKDDANKKEMKKAVFNIHIITYMCIYVHINAFIYDYIFN